MTVMYIEGRFNNACDQGTGLLYLGAPIKDRVAAEETVKDIKRRKTEERLVLSSAVGKAVILKCTQRMDFCVHACMHACMQKLQNTPKDALWGWGYAEDKCPYTGSAPTPGKQCASVTFPVPPPHYFAIWDIQVRRKRTRVIGDVSMADFTES